MAIGDIDGDLPLTNSAKNKQTSFDQTNLPAQYRNQAAGPVSRASQQLPSLNDSPRAGAAVTQPIQSLDRSTPAAGQPTSADAAGVASQSMAPPSFPGAGTQSAGSQPSSLYQVGMNAAALTRPLVSLTPSLQQPPSSPGSDSLASSSLGSQATAQPAQAASMEDLRRDPVVNAGTDKPADLPGSFSTGAAGSMPSLFDMTANSAALTQPQVSFPSTSSAGVASTAGHADAGAAESAPSANQAAAPSGVGRPAVMTGQQAGGGDPTLNGFQPTGIGANAQGGQIVGKVGADGVPSFSNDPNAQRDASGRPTLNGFTGQSNFSVGAPGDAARAMAGYQRLEDMRQGWANQDRLDNALAEDYRANHFNVVHDSSRPLSVKDQQMDAYIDQSRQNTLRNVQVAQSVYDNSIQRQGAQQQLRQASRLEDLQSAAFAPGAPASAQAAYRQAVDPTGEKSLDRQLKQATIDNKNANTAKANQQMANGGRKVGNLPVGLQKLEDNDIDALANVKSMNTQLGNINQQIDNGTLKLSAGGNLVNKVMNFTGQSSQESANFASFQAAMEKMRNDSLRLNKGTQTEGDAVRAWNELFANTNDAKVVKQRLSEIQALNAQASKVRVGMINSRRKNQGIGPLDTDEVLDGSIGLSPDQGASQQAQQAQQPAPQPAAQARAAAPAAQGQKKDHSALWGG